VAVDRPKRGHGHGHGHNGTLVHDVERFAMPPPPPAYQEIIRNRIADHIQRKQTTDIMRRTKECISFSPTLCAAIRGSYDADSREENDCDSRLFPCFVSGMGVGVAYLNMHISGPILTHLPMTFVSKHN
jgi:hypothetical protein